MDYGLRINHHAKDHGALILGGIRPALEDMRREGLPVAAALRPHWLHGPHILVGLEVIGDEAGIQTERAWSALADGARAWLATAPPRPPLDASAFESRMRALAILEGVRLQPGALHADGDVERGRYAVPDPLDAACLAPPRDRFKADTLDDAFALIALRLESPEQARRDGLNFWPLSLQGQALASGRSLPAAMEALAERVRALRPAVLARIGDAGLFEPARGLDPTLQGWVNRLQRAYDDMLRVVDAAPADFVPGINARALRANPPDPASLRNSDRQTIAAMDHPTQFAYRMLMNFLYDLFPTVGFTPLQRFLVCRLIVDTLQTAYPRMMERAYAHGAALCR
jgi:hypothetical protein